MIISFFFFFFNDTATTEIYTLSLHDALPICCRGLLRRTLAGFNWEALCNRHRVRTGAGSPMARPSDSRYGPLWAVPVFQRQLRGVEPLAVCLRPPPDDSSAFRHGPRKVSDAFHGRSWNHHRDARGSSAGGRTTRSRNRSRLYGLGLGLVRGVSLVLDGREASNDSDCDWAGNRGLLAALPDESSASLSRPLFARRMDRPWDLGWSRIRSPRPELKWNIIFEVLGARREKNAIRCEAAFERWRALVYTFGGDSLRHR